MNMHAHHFTRHQVIALLEERDTLREQVRQLEELLRPTIIPPAAWRLSRMEADFLNALRAAAPGMVHRERMMIALYGLSDEPPEPKILDVYLCKVRRRLMEAQARIEIETIYGRGWRLTCAAPAARGSGDRPPQHRMVPARLAGAPWRLLRPRRAARPDLSPEEGSMTPAIIPELRERAGKDRVTDLLRAAQRPETRHLWMPEDAITFTPAVLSNVFGDGRALFTLTTINNRPAYWIIRGCSSWRVSDYDAPAHAEEFSEHVDEIVTAIEEEFGTTAYYEMNAQGRWVDEETKRFVPYSYVDYPVIDPSMGSAWGRMSWPDLPGVETVPHPFAAATILADSPLDAPPASPVKPVRLQLSRKKGFDLQAHSRAVNGLPAVNVARPSRWGNPYDWREWRDGFPQDVLRSEGPVFRDQWCRNMAADAYRQDLEDGEIIAADLHFLRGRNLACWCPLGSPCHADVLLRLANGPACEALDAPPASPLATGEAK